MRSERENLLLFDGGNLFFREAPKNRSERQRAIEKVEVLIQSYKAMDYDGVNIGEKDLILGYSFLKEVARRASFPFISSNLLDRTENQLAFRPYIFKDVAGLKIGIFGLLDNKRVKKNESSIGVSNPMKETKAVVGSLRKECDLIIALSQLGEAGDIKLARALPGIDVIIGSVKGKTVGYSKVGNTIMVRVIPRGGYLGVLDLHIIDRNPPYRFFDLGDHDELVRKIERIRFQSDLIQDTIDELPSKEKKAKLRELEILRQRERGLQAQVGSHKDRNTFRNQVIPISLRIEDDPLVGRLVEEYRK